MERPVFPVIRRIRKTISRISEAFHFRFRLICSRRPPSRRASSFPAIMSEDNSPAPEATASKTAAAPRVRRISNPRPKKTAAATKAAEAAALEAVAEAPVPIIPAPPLPEPEFTPESRDTDEEESPRGNQDWPEPETSSDSQGNQSENNKRKRRRRKGKGGQNQNGPSSGGGGGDDFHASSEAQSQPQSQPQQQQPRPVGQNNPQQPQHQQPRNSLNPEILAKKAWKIFLAEVSEEGVALISDHDARELSKRCFRLAEIFIEEQSRKVR